MWLFGGGLFLVIISQHSLQLTAVYGLSLGLSSLLFGSLVGHIVDKSPRLKGKSKIKLKRSLPWKDIFCKLKPIG